jgi:hypothetical protein
MNQKLERYGWLTIWGVVRLVGIGAAIAFAPLWSLDVM